MILLVSILSLNTTQYANSSSNNESFLTIIYHWFTGNHKHYERKSTDNMHITAEDVFNQFRHDKKQEIPNHNIEAIITIVRPELDSLTPTALYNSDYINQLLYSAIITEHGNKVKMYLDEKDNQLRPIGLPLNAQAKKDILTSEENNIRVSIEQGDSLHTFYSQYYKTRIDTRLSNPTYAQQTFNHPYRGR